MFVKVALLGTYNNWWNVKVVSVDKITINFYDTQ